ncbi:MAG: septum formation initiator family protein [Ignavibacteriaceae bacterium]
MFKFKSNKIKIYIFLILFLIGLAFLFFNEFGILKYKTLKDEVKTLNKQITDTQKENRDLEEGIDSLRKEIPAKIEKTAREKYNMIRKGEKAVKVKEK